MMNQNVVVEKMTYVKALEVALSCDALPVEVREKLSALRDQQVKRNSAEKKPTKVQQENEGVKSHVLEVLASCDKPVTVSELMQADDQLSQLSNQKVASLVRQLVEAGKVQRLEEKRKAYFTLVK